MIPAGNIIAIGISMAVAILFPIFLMIWLHRRRKISFKAVGIGVGIFILFALVLEQLMHYAVLKLAPGVFETTWTFVTYGCLAAGVFEETGRFVAFRFLLKKKREWKDGIAYGIGHGGIESVLLGGLSFLGLLITAISMNNGTIPLDTLSAEAREQLRSLGETMAGSHWSQYLLGGIERIMAVTAHIGFSLVVLYGVRNNRIIFLLYAILLHASMNISAALYQKGILDVWVVESIVAIYAGLALYFISRSEKYFPPSSEEDISAGTSQ
jgi:uncharacterized membrane protein YhfC